MMSIYDEINLEIQKNNEKIKLFNINPIDLTQKTKIDKFLNTNGFNKALKFYWIIILKMDILMLVFLLAINIIVTNVHTKIQTKI